MDSSSKHHLFAHFQQIVKKFQRWRTFLDEVTAKRTFHQLYLFTISSQNVWAPSFFQSGVKHFIVRLMVFNLGIWNCRDQCLWFQLKLYTVGPLFSGAVTFSCILIVSNNRKLTILCFVTLCGQNKFNQAQCYIPTTL